MIGKYSNMVCAILCSKHSSQYNTITFAMSSTSITNDKMRQVKANCLKYIDFIDVAQHY